MQRTLPGIDDGVGAKRSPALSEVFSKGGEGGIELAKEVVKRCKDCGVELTPAGSAYPYHNDPNNSNIRIAPSFPSILDLETATKILCLSVKIEYALKK